MPTFIDQLIVSLGLDSRGFDVGSANAEKSFKRTKQAAVSSANEIEASGKKAANYFSALKSEVVGLFLAYAGAGKIAAFVMDQIHQSANLGRTSEIFGEDIKSIKAWQQAYKEAGGDVNAVGGALSKIADIRANFQTNPSAVERGLMQRLGIFKVEDFKDFDTLMNKLGANFAKKIAIAKAKDAKVGGDQAQRDVKNVFRQQVQELLGLDNTGILILERYNKGLGEHIDQLEANVQITKEDTEAAQKFEASMSHLGDAFGRATLLMTPFIEGVAKLLDHLAGYDDGTPKTVVKSYAGAGPGISAALSIMDYFNGGSSEASGPPTQPLPVSGDAMQRRRIAYGNIFRQNGFSEAATQGIMAGMEAENGTLDPHRKNPISSAYGLGQWMAGQWKNGKYVPKRQDDFRRVMGKDIRQSSASEQIKFMIWEMRNSEKKPGNRIKRARTSQEALGHYVTGFMRPAKGHETTSDIRRGLNAIQRQRAYAAGNSTTHIAVTVNGAGKDGHAIGREIAGGINSNLRNRSLSVHANSGVSG